MNRLAANAGERRIKWTGSPDSSRLPPLYTSVGPRHDGLWQPAQSNRIAMNGFTRHYRKSRSFHVPTATCMPEVPGWNQSMKVSHGYTESMNLIPLETARNYPEDRRRCANGPVRSNLISSLWRDTPVLRNTDFNWERMVWVL